MKKILILVLLAFQIYNTKACCIGYFVNIYPAGSKLSPNGLIVIDYAEGHFKIFDQLDTVSFVLKSREASFPLTMIQKTKGHSTYAQIILKLGSNLPINKGLYLTVIGLDSSLDNSIKFFRSIRKTWVIREEPDFESPQFVGKIDVSYEENFNSSASGHGFRCFVQYVDLQIDSFYTNKKWNTELLVEVSDNKGMSYYIPVKNNKFSIYDGMCGATFEIPTNSQIEYSIRLIDFSGNISKESKKLILMTSGPCLPKVGG